MKYGRRWVSLLLAVIMVLSMAPVGLAAEGFVRSRSWSDSLFTDVPKDQWYYETVREAYELSLMSGDAGGTFRPDGNVTLAETVTVAARIHAIATTGSEAFTQGSPWYQVYVDYALANGILAQGLAEYDRPATRLEFAKILAKALPERDLKAINTVDDGAIPDVADEEAVYLLYRAGVLTGNDAAGTFAPGSNIRRSEVAAIVARMALPKLRKSITLTADQVYVPSAGNHGTILDWEENEKAPLPDDDKQESTVIGGSVLSATPSEDVAYSTDQIMIKLSGAVGADMLTQLNAAGVTAVRELIEVLDGVWYEADISGDVQTVMEKVCAIEGILSADYSYIYEADDLDRDELDDDYKRNGKVEDQWHLETSDIPDSWHYHNHHKPGKEDCDGSCKKCPESGDKKHDWEEISNTAGCTETGTKTSRCRHCGMVIQEHSPANGHNITKQWRPSEDGKHHVRGCTNCDKVTKAEKHVFVYDREKGELVCVVCQAVHVMHQEHDMKYAPVDAEKHSLSCSGCDYAVEQQHTWGDVTDTATCTAAGQRQYSCVLCGYTKAEYSPAYGHKAAQQWQQSADGSYHYRLCLTCGQEADKSAHVFAYDAEKEDHTCTVCGVWHLADLGHTMTYSTKDADVHLWGCAACGLSVEKRHTWELTDDTAACTEDGEKQYACALCGDTKEEVSPAKGHDPAEAWEPSEDGRYHCRLCLTCGEEVETGAHAYVYDEAKDDFYCDICEAWHTEDLGHELELDGHCPDCDLVGACKHPAVTWQKDAEDETLCGPVCESCGEYTAEPTAHIREYRTADEDVHALVCVNCGDSVEEAHDWTLTDNTATCTEAGVRQYLCALCGDTKEEDSPAKGHTLAEGWKLPADGSYHYRLCLTCEAELFKAEHAYTYDEASDDHSCSACGAWHTADLGHVLPLDGHCPSCSLVGPCKHPTVVWQKDAADETLCGPVCGSCGAYAAEPTAHVREYRADNEESHALVCIKCGDVVKQAHTWEEISNTATCAEAGEKTYHCALCGGIKTEESPALGHTMSEQWQHTEDGQYHFHSCTVCGAQEDLAKHTYEEADGDYRCTVCALLHNAGLGHSANIFGYCEQCGKNLIGSADPSAPGEGVVVAVIDTGVDYTHEDLKDNIWFNGKEIADNGIDDDKNGYIDDYYGFDASANKGSGMDDNGHGTHVAGIIAGVNNNLGILGVAYGAKVMPVKAGQSSGYFNDIQVVKAIKYAFENGADVINMSFGSTVCNAAVREALETASTRCVLVASAGNDGIGTDGAAVYPAALDCVIGVMSVGSDGVESSFTNWNGAGLSYEIYAPGEQILSTLPGDRYAAWSGTSMAAPVASGVAAIVRSFYSDVDTYPAKFVAGQLAAASKVETVSSFEDNGEHSMGGMLNAYAALTELPKPELSIVDHVFFDSGDDGAIDAGETVDLGFTLRNRWGKSKNTTVTVSAQSGAAKYVSFASNGASYGSIGTYSTGDAGKIWEDGMFVGWENPVRMTVSSDCPNNYVLLLDVIVTYENGWDETDTTVYTVTETVPVTVRRGELLPRVITEDMVLTADKQYILPNYVVIEKGVTVTAEAGTQIQFWSADAESAYDQLPIVDLTVKGKFITNGTKDVPVRIYPDEMMPDYRVDIKSYGNNAVVELNHTEVINPFFTMTNGSICAENCSFRQNVERAAYGFRQLQGSKVTESSSHGCLKGRYTDCIMEGLGGFGYSTHPYAFGLSGTYDGCIFADCYLQIPNYPIFDNCVFYGNNNDLQSGRGGASQYTGKNLTISDIKTYCKTAYWEDMGITYLQIAGSEKLTDRFADYLGADPLHIDSEAEQAFVAESFEKYGTASYQFYELHGEVLVTDIILDDTAVTMDLTQTYQIGAVVTPATADATKLVYESQNTSVATVSASGLVTPVALGEAVIRVYSPDLYLYTELTVTVAEEVALEAIDLGDDITVEKGVSYRLQPTLTPENAAKVWFEYSVDNEDVLTVSKNGVITPKTVGTAQVTVTEPVTGLTDTITVTVAIAIKEFTASQELFAINAGETVSAAEFFGITIAPVDATNQNIVWETSQESVAKVDENGDLITGEPGFVVLRATVEGTEHSVEVGLYVCESLFDGKVVQVERYYQMLNTLTSGFVALLDDGTLWSFGGTTNVAPIDVLFKDVAQFEFFDISYWGILNKNGELNIYGRADNTATPSENKTSVNPSFLPSSAPLTQVKSLEGCPAAQVLYAVLENGTVWACTRTWTNAKFAKSMLAQGTDDPSSTNGYAAVENVAQVACNNDYDNPYVVFLHEDGSASYAGTSDKISTPTKFAEGVLSVTSGYEHVIVEYEDGYRFGLDSESTLYPKMKDMTFSSGWRYDAEHPYNCMYLDDGTVYAKGYNVYGELATGVATNNTQWTPVEGLTDVENVFMLPHNTFFQTADGFYFAGRNEKNHLLPAYGMGHAVTPKEVWFGVPNGHSTTFDLSPDKYNYTLTEDYIILTADRAIRDATCKLRTSTDSGATLYTPSLIESVEVDLNRIIVRFNLSDLRGDLHHYQTKRFSLDVVAHDYHGVEFSENNQHSLYFSTDLIKAADLPSTTAAASVSTQTTEGTESSILEQMPTVTEFSNGVHINEGVERGSWSVERLQAMWDAFAGAGFNGNIYHSAILNRLVDADATLWLRPQAPEGYSNVYSMGGNYWGTTNETLIGKQILDREDYSHLGKINYSNYLTEVPEELWPVVTDAGLVDEEGNKLTNLSGGTATMFVEFNRDMDTSVELDVRHGSAYPYTDYQVEGAFVSPRRWEGTVKVNTLIEGGEHRMRITNGCAADEPEKELIVDWGRFGFTLDTTQAMAMNLQAVATDTGITLNWYQDDFDTLAGYNLYRSTSEDGQYVKVNPTVIPASVTTWHDDGVQPATVYYYNFTVVKTDLTESTPSGKTRIASKDTMAPSLYHTPVTNAFMGQNLAITATASDNLGVQSVTLHYRTVGASDWTAREMTKLNDKYSAIISYNDLTLAGIEYYITASDGISTVSKGTAAAPYTVTVQQAVTSGDMGDINADGKVTVLDVLMVLQAINDLYNMPAEEFVRADLNGDGELTAAEALRILHYANGKIGSLTVDEGA